MKLLEPQTSLALKNVLYLTDFSDASQNALAHAMALTASYQAKLFVLHVVPPEPHLAVPLDPIPRAMDSALADGERQMENFLRAHPLQGLRHEVAVSEGDMEAVILDLVEHAGIDLIVMGTHGRTGMEKVVVGSTTEMILRLSPIPVLTIGPACGRRYPESRRIKAVLFATDFSSNSIAALPYACTVARENRARLIIVHVLAGDVSRDEEIAAQLRQRLIELLPVGVLSNCESEFLVEFGSPAEKILAIARNAAADLLVLGVRAVPHPALTAHLPWPLLSAVLAHAPCPVLTVRRELDYTPG